MTAKKAFLLRIDRELWAALERLAQSELRSVNAEIEFLLREALRSRGIAPRPAPANRVSPRRGPA
ncbi:MAG TPA: toxin-antitoxin system HicB family antitoxin [Casimicrobiaceae bacterium]